MDISTLIIALIYIDCFCDNNKYILTLNNVYRILLSACLLSLKFNEDAIINYKYYSEIAAVSVEDLSKLEFYMYLKLHFSMIYINHITLILLNIQFQKMNNSKIRISF